MKSSVITLPPHVAEVDIVYRSKIKAVDRPIINGSSGAYALFIDTWDMDKIDLVEQFRVMLLDRKNSCMGIATVATGGMTNCIADPKIVFAMALKARAANLILAHNHPSGGKTASRGDISLTESFVQAGKILTLPVLDHLIITRDSYYSFADDGLAISTPFNAHSL